MIILYEAYRTCPTVTAELMGVQAQNTAKAEQNAILAKVRLELATKYYVSSYVSVTQFHLPKSTH